ncbi:MAG: hypothetical protein L0H70_05630, partial [Xanthomonadales bacterium]|nr:hypothetical protein [Xanthomonadales bacterium]
MGAPSALASGGTQAGAAVDWARDVGRLNVRQLRRVLDVVEIGVGLAKSMPADALDAHKDISTVLPV